MKKVYMDEKIEQYILDIVFATRQPNGQNIKIEYEKPIIHSDAVTMTNEINKRISARIKKNPEQWYWLHNRWNKE